MSKQPCPVYETVGDGMPSGTAQSSTEYLHTSTHLVLLLCKHTLDVNINTEAHSLKRALWQQWVWHMLATSFSWTRHMRVGWPVLCFVFSSSHCQYSQFPCHSWVSQSAGGVEISKQITFLYMCLTSHFNMFLDLLQHCNVVTATQCCCKLLKLIKVKNSKEPYLSWQYY